MYKKTLAQKVNRVKCYKKQDVKASRRINKTKHWNTNICIHANMYMYIYVCITIYIYIYSLFKRNVQTIHCSFQNVRERKCISNCLWVELKRLSYETLLSCSPPSQSLPVPSSSPPDRWLNLIYSCDTSHLKLSGIWYPSVWSGLNFFRALTVEIKINPSAIIWWPPTDDADIANQGSSK